VPTVFVTGGAGYVGSHSCKAFSARGWKVITVDNLSRGHAESVKWGPLCLADIGDGAAMIELLRRHRPDLVLHFAAYAYVGESVQSPELYYRNNSAGTLTLLEAMRESGTSRLVFSSSCATYGHPLQLPITEDHPQSPINPYGWSKMIVERMIEDFGRAYGLSSVSLRYFNAAGCDVDGELGERHDPETHAVPLAIRAALTRDQPFSVLGTDFDTPDGTAIRDYIHVTDLAHAHVLAAEMLLRQEGSHAFNLGTGVGTSVLELLAAVKRVTGCEPLVRFDGRRPGDPAALVASAARAEYQLGWRPEHSEIDHIVRTAAAWQKQGMAVRTQPRTP
jgi:UDP-arabinose 4-epimerase